MGLGLDIIPFFQLFDSATGYRRNTQIGRDAQDLVIRVDHDGYRLAGGFDIKVGTGFLDIERNRRQALVALGSKLHIDWQLEVVVILLDRAAGDKLAGPRSDNNIVALKFRDARTLDQRAKK